VGNTAIPEVIAVYGICCIAFTEGWNYSVHNRFSAGNSPELELLMTHAIAPALSSRNWKELYTAALFENDNDRVLERIADAERAIIDRARELFSAGCDTIEEDQALDDALYALRALQSCLQQRVTA
jgi:hypothetical protein